ncbi:hypothetical protein MNBD_GAMMA15-65 [hydrothermal vent metagenome]|uniref:Uncharacterized protein n=1 Tax=hydrothermal vent metagenome TaxID=652676 RepID=A0A3B0Y7P8_9ZZZZ
MPKKTRELQNHHFDIDRGGRDVLWSMYSHHAT